MSSSINQRGIASFMSAEIVVPHRLPGPPREAVLLERENRFLARCRFPSGEIVHAHVPDRGRLLTLLVPATRVWLYAAAPGARRTAWSLLVAEDPGTRVLVAIDPAGANARVRALLPLGLVPGIEPDWTVTPEVAVGSSRIDFMLSRGRERLALEVKSVGVVRDGTALFPDAPTLRGARHLEELAAFVRSRRGRAMVLFVAQRADSERVTPDEAIDPLFAETLRRVAPHVALAAIRFEIRPDGCVYRGALPVELHCEAARRFHGATSSQRGATQRTGISTSTGTGRGTSSSGIS